jgi:hypothetical protein
VDDAERKVAAVAVVEGGVGFLVAAVEHMVDFLVPYPAQAALPKVVQVDQCFPPVQVVAPHSFVEYHSGHSGYYYDGFDERP